MKRLILPTFILLIVSLNAGAQGTMTSIIRSWGFIGDSLCSGEMECYAPGKDKVSYVDMYEYSWGQQLCRLTGSEGWNFSKGGQTAQGWLSDLRSERGWGYAQSHPKQAYIIALGVNDFSKASRGDDGFSLESYKKAMGKIVRGLKTVQPKARIFILTRPKGSSTGDYPYDKWNDVARDLASANKYVYVIDMFKDAPVYDKDFREKYYLNGHMSPAGYLWTAMYLNEAIGKIIEDNPQDFRDIALVGTHWSATPGSVPQLGADWAKFGRYADDNASVQASPKAVLFGDSITQNWASFDPEWFKEHNFVGRGISGQTTAEMLVRFRADVIDLHPKYVVILAGINDIAQNNGYISVENVFGNIVSMVELAKAAKIKPVLCTVLPAGEIGWRPLLGDPRPQIAKLNAMIKEYAKSSRIPLVDYHSSMRDDADALDPKYQKDAVHPSLPGYKVMESLVLPVLK